MIPRALALATEGRPSATLPAQPGRMIDREDELRDVCERLCRPDVRLVTLTGPAGSGKTRLAVAAAGTVATSSIAGTNSDLGGRERASAEHIGTLDRYLDTNNNCATMYTTVIEGGPRWGVDSHKVRLRQ